MTTQELLKTTKSAWKSTNTLSSETKNAVLAEMANELLLNTDEILEKNKLDVEKSRGIINDVMIDRLTLTKDRIKAMADGILEVSKLEDPVGCVLGEHTHPNGMLIKKVSVPIGVVSIIYESRPNVTSDAASLCFKSGNACVLRTGKEAYNSAFAIVSALKKALKKHNISPEMINLVSDTTRESARETVRSATLLVE